MVDRLIDRCVSVHMDKRLGRWNGGWMDEEGGLFDGLRIDELLVRWINGWMDGLFDGYR